MSISAGNVLIVEDDPEVREMITALLATEGFYAVAAGTASRRCTCCARCAIERRTRRAWSCSI